MRHACQKAMHNQGHDGRAQGRSNSEKNNKKNGNSSSPVKTMGEKRSEGPTPAIEADLRIKTDVTPKEWKFAPFIFCQRMTKY